MKIEVRNLGKRYRLEWVLRDLSHTFLPGSRTAVIGPNGAGKSTLLRLLSGHLTPSRGSIHYTFPEAPLPRSEVFRHLAIAAPYIELIEELSLQETLRFHRQFKPWQTGLNDADLMDILGFPKRTAEKPVRNFSSGMKQRLKLALNICSATPMLLLDEPSTNLDDQGVSWYQDLIQQFGQNRLIVVASNVAGDYQFCPQNLDLRDFKLKKAQDRPRGQNFESASN